MEVTAKELLVNIFVIPPTARYNTFLAFFMFGFVELCSSILLPVTFPSTWKKLSSDDHLQLNIATVSSAHCVGILYLTYFILQEDSFLEQNVFYQNSENTRALFALSAGYFIWDVIIVFRTSPFDYKFFFHGIVCLTIYWVNQRPFLHYYGFRFLLFELSTPFLNLRKYVALLRGEDHALVKPLSWLFGISFLVVRILWGIPLMYRFQLVAYEELSTLSLGGNADEVARIVIIVWLLVIGILMTILNLVWMWEMIKMSQETQKEKTQ
mmetsp:Transcript_10338/g.11876  ORF Transcript_10338/g.11876 Transcript_10338/m.11876 type:complete len:267 (+) Transcript_10338:220-1020(+)